MFWHWISELKELSFEIWYRKILEAAPWKLNNVTKQSEVRQQRGFRTSVRKTCYFNCGKHLKRWRVTITISKKTICEACIIRTQWEPIARLLFEEVGQANKSARGMPWHQEPTKDVTSCDKPRGGANIRYIRGFPNGGTRWSNTPASCIESNRCTWGTAWTETSK